MIYREGSHPVTTSDGAIISTGNGLNVYINSRINRSLTHHVVITLIIEPTTADCTTEGDQDIAISANMDDIKYHTFTGKGLFNGIC